MAKSVDVPDDVKAKDTVKITDLPGVGAATA